MFHIPSYTYGYFEMGEGGGVDWWSGVLEKGIVFSLIVKFVT